MPRRAFRRLWPHGRSGIPWQAAHAGCAVGDDPICALPDGEATPSAVTVMMVAVREMKSMLGALRTIQDV